MLDFLSNRHYTAVKTADKLSTLIETAWNRACIMFNQFTARATTTPASVGQNEACPYRF
jgi:hypothetical protein